MITFVPQEKHKVEGGISQSKIAQKYGGPEGIRKLFKAERLYVGMRIAEELGKDKAAKNMARMAFNAFTQACAPYYRDERNADVKRREFSEVALRYGGMEEINKLPGPQKMMVELKIAREHEDVETINKILSILNEGGRTWPSFPEIKNLRANCLDGFTLEISNKLIFSIARGYNFGFDGFFEAYSDTATKRSGVYIDNRTIVDGLANQSKEITKNYLISRYDYRRLDDRFKDSYEEYQPEEKSNYENSFRLKESLVREVFYKAIDDFVAKISYPRPMDLRIHGAMLEKFRLYFLLRLSQATPLRDEELFDLRDRSRGISLIMFPEMTSNGGNLEKEFFIKSVIDRTAFMINNGGIIQIIDEINRYGARSGNPHDYVSVTIDTTPEVKKVLEQNMEKLIKQLGAGVEVLIKFGKLTKNPGAIHAHLHLDGDLTEFNYLVQKKNTGSGKKRKPPTEEEVAAAWSAVDRILGLESTWTPPNTPPPLQ